MVGMEYVGFYGNQLTGTIPNLTNMENLLWLAIDQNMLTGTLKTELGLFGKLTKISIHENMLTGTLPSELGLLEKLKEVTAGFNDLSGTIPQELGHLLARNETLKIFNSGGNSGFFGFLPEELCALQTDVDGVLSFDCTDQLGGCSCNCSDAMNATFV